MNNSSIEDQIKAFFQGGGKIQQIPEGVSAEKHKPGQVPLVMTSERRKADIKRKLGEGL